MKKNTQKILLALYSKRGEIQNRVPIHSLQLIVPQLSDGGFRSLLHNLKKQSCITSQRVLGITSISITQYGVELLESEFPALSQQWEHWDGKGECLVFLDSPADDPQFRNLRKAVLSQGATTINRGVYFCPGGFSTSIFQKCISSYRSNVLIFSVSEWKILAESSFMIEKYGLLDLAETYSGVSTDVTNLLESAVAKKRLTKTDKGKIHLVYDRVVEILLEDPGFCTFYLPEAQKAQTLVLQLNSVLSFISIPK